jgi:hypothetical protein
MLLREGQHIFNRLASIVIGARKSGPREGLKGAHHDIDGSRVSSRSKLPLDQVLSPLIMNGHSEPRLRRRLHGATVSPHLPLSSPNAFRWMLLLIRPLLVT